MGSTRVQFQNYYGFYSLTLGSTGEKLVEELYNNKNINSRNIYIAVSLRGRKLQIMYQGPIPAKCKLQTKIAKITKTDNSRLRLQSSISNAAQSIAYYIKKAVIIFSAKNFLGEGKKDIMLKSAMSKLE